MYPILYPTDELTTHQTAEPFQGGGIGALSDVIKCIVTEERNGVYEAELEYPAIGIWADELMVGRVLKIKANDQDSPQLFQIYTISKTLGSVYEIKAEHISYRLNGVPVKPWTAAGPAAVLAGIESHAVTPTGFTFSTDLTSTASYKIETPRSVRALLGGSEDSLIDIYGGELHFDNFHVSLLSHRGADNGVEIRYAKNLTALTYDEQGDVYNGVLPYWYSESQGIVYPSSPVTIATSDPIPRYEVVDMSGEFESKPTAAQLTAKAQELLRAYTPAIIHIDASFVDLSQMTGYEYVAFERVSLCDTVTVIYEALGMSVKAKVVKTVYDALTERYESVDIGTLQTSLADILTSPQMSSGTGTTAAGAVYAQAKGSASSISITSDINKIPLTAFSYCNPTDLFSISNGGVKVTQAGLYRVSGSVYINPPSGASMVGVYAKKGASYSRAPEVNGAYYGVGGADTSRAVIMASKLVSLSAGDIVYLAGRCADVNGMAYPSHDSTFLLIDKIA